MQWNPSKCLLRAADNLKSDSAKSGLLGEHGATSSPMLLRLKCNTSVGLASSCWRSISIFPDEHNWSVGSTTSGSSGQPVSWSSHLVPCAPGEWCLICHRTMWACIFQQKAEFWIFLFLGRVRWPYSSDWLFNSRWWCTQFSPPVTMLYLFIYHPFATCIALGQVKQSIRQERNNDSQTFYKNYIISFNKSIRINVQYKLRLSSSIVVY